ncbi:MAG: hypothetical protein DRG78_05705 [Epsilonproteobacteria bacterium]|nr:MAG: hypothetical protein DRG78_05705 [Campylobacterota bacterium]
MNEIQIARIEILEKVIEEIKTCGDADSPFADSDLLKRLLLQKVDLETLHSDNIRKLNNRDESQYLEYRKDLEALDQKIKKIEIEIIFFGGIQELHELYESFYENQKEDTKVIENQESNTYRDELHLSHIKDLEKAKTKKDISWCIDSYLNYKAKSNVSALFDNYDIQDKESLVNKKQEIIKTYYSNISTERELIKQVEEINEKIFILEKNTDTDSKNKIKYLQIDINNLTMKYNKLVA